jgi:hypothetical protein
MEQKILIFDSSTIISLSLNNLLYILERLHEKHNIRFIITEEVKYEIVEKPLQIKRFELEALMIQELLDKGVIELPAGIQISNKEIKEKTFGILKAANSSFMARGEWIKLLSAGEGSCFALGEILRGKGIDYALAIDERTARMLSEKPENLQKLLGKKLHTPLKMQRGNLDIFSDTRIIRSAELCYIAYKDNLIGISDGIRLIDAMLYAAKYKGCAISTQEIEAIKKMI